VWKKLKEQGHTLVVVDNVAQVVAAAVVGFAHAHRVVREVDVAVVAEDWGVSACEAQMVCEERKILTLGHFGGVVSRAVATRRGVVVWCVAR
jgi:hypothetical protein